MNKIKINKPNVSMKKGTRAIVESVIIAMIGLWATYISYLIRMIGAYIVEVDWRILTVYPFGELYLIVAVTSFILWISHALIREQQGSFDK